MTALGDLIFCITLRAPGMKRRPTILHLQTRAISIVLQTKCTAYASKAYTNEYKHVQPTVHANASSKNCIFKQDPQFCTCTQARPILLYIKTRRANVQMTHIQVQTQKGKTYKFCRCDTHQYHTKHTVYDFFLKYIATIQPLNNSGQE